MEDEIYILRFQKIKRALSDSPDNPLGVEDILFLINLIEEQGVKYYKLKEKVESTYKENIRIKKELKNWMP